MNLHQKIVEIRKSIGSLNKDKKGFNFSYVTGDQILGKIKDKMNELGVILQPSTKPGEWQKHEYKNKHGKDKIDFIVWGEGSYTWINADEPSDREVIQFAYYGQQGDDLSQAYGTALTYTERYFLLKYFGIPTDGDDPDHRRHNQGSTNQQQSKQQQQPQQQQRTPDMMIAEIRTKVKLKGMTVADIENAEKNNLGNMTPQQLAEVINKLDLTPNAG